MRVAASAAVVRSERSDRASTVHGVGRHRSIRRTASRDPRPARGRRRARLERGDPGRGERAGEKRGSLTGRSPVDRGKKGSKIHIISDANGIPLVTGVSAANTHDSVMLQPMVESIPRIRSVRGPRRGKPAKLRADKGYDYDARRRWLRARGIVPRASYRPSWDRGPQEIGSSSVEDRTHHRVVYRISAIDNPLRTPRPPLRSISTTRRSSHLLQETIHVRRPLILQPHLVMLCGMIFRRVDGRGPGRVGGWVG